MSFKVRLANKPLNKLLKKTLSIYLNKRFNIHYDDEAIRGLEPPFIIVANHQTNWDPFILSYKIETPVHFVTSVQQFRSPFMRFVLGLAGSIPKTKSMSDAAAVRGILKIRNLNGVIGVFPEGKRCWDGQTEEILYPTAKVIKQLKIPVVSVLFQGGYLSSPRWAQKSRRGEMHLKYQLLVDKEDIFTLSVDDIYSRMCGALHFSECEWQRKRMIPFTGSKLAESLELSLFLCPECMEIGKLRSAGDYITCLSCGEKLRYNTYGFFEKEGARPRFQSVFEWNQWQLVQLDKMIQDRLQGVIKPIFSDEEARLFTAAPYGPLRRKAKGNLTLYLDRIEFQYHDGHIERFPIKDLNGVSTHLSKGFDFHYNGDFFRALFKDRHVSANKWSEAYDRIMKAINASKLII